MQIKIFFSYCVFDANMADHSKVKLLPMFRSAQVQKSKNLQEPLANTLVTAGRQSIPLFLFTFS